MPQALEDRYVFETADRGLAVKASTGRYDDHMLQFINYVVATYTANPPTNRIEVPSDCSLLIQTPGLLAVSVLSWAAYL